MHLTTNFSLKKPDGTDPVKLQDLNDNADTLDAELALQQTAIDAANTHSKSAHVTGTKGSSETAYRTGQVNITKDNIGLGNVPNVATNDQTPTYTEATVLSELTSGERLSAALGKLKLAVKNVKTLLQLLGSTDISGVGNGTVTGALAAINSNLEQQIIGVEAWRNSSPNNAFSGGPASLTYSASEYHYIEILYKISISSQAMETTGRIPIISGVVPLLSYYGYRQYQRPITTISANSLTFADCQSNGIEIDNTLCIPYEIIFYKKC